MTELYGIWFEKSGWWAPVRSNRVFAVPYPKEAFAQLRVLLKRNVGRVSEPNMEALPGEWYDVPRVAGIANDGSPKDVKVPA